MSLTVEMKAVNHRYCEIIVRLPKAWSMLEDRVKKIAGQFVQRGRVDVTVTIEQGAAETAGFSIDWNAAEQYVEAARQMNERFSLQETLTAKDLLTMPGVVQMEEALQLPPEEVEASLASVVHDAASELLAMKQAEGKKLAEDLGQRLSQITAWTERIAELAPQAVEEYRKRLHQRLAEMLGDAPFQLDQQRLAQEIALFAERSDISEEIIRLQSHCIQFAEQLTKTEAVGRKLDFYLQEMNREANTIAAKANHLPIQHLAVEMKTELEKMREQVQNIE